MSAKITLSDCDLAVVVDNNSGASAIHVTKEFSESNHDMCENAMALLGAGLVIANPDKFKKEYNMLKKATATGV